MLLGYIDKWCRSLRGESHGRRAQGLVDGFCRFMAGRTDEVTRALTDQMMHAAEELDFENAARLRDDLTAVEKVMEKQAVVLGGRHRCGCHCLCRG